MRFHVLGLAHTATNKDYLGCAFTQKVLNFCQMMTDNGHTVYHYGNELSDVPCTEHVTVVPAGDIAPPEMSGVYNVDTPLYRLFNHNTAAEIWRRKEAGDFLICMWAAHKFIADAHPDLISVEAGIGYGMGHFAQYKVFESYAMLHAYRGLTAVSTATGNGWWYDAVIPNYFDPKDFTYSSAPGDYLLFMGNRLGAGAAGKGIAVALDIARLTGKKLIVAGPGPMLDPPAGVEVVGHVGVEQRRVLYTRALATLTPSMFVEPFCGVSVESMMSGTPVISTDWGAFAENVIQGVTGYRCRTMEQFTWAVANAHKIDRAACCRWAKNNFSLERVAKMYEEFFRSVCDVHGGQGFYQERPERTELDWLRRKHPYDRG